jgi:ABC-2 type transport system permease protein
VATQRRQRTAVPFPILELTLRQFTGGKAIRVVGLFALLPALFAAIYWINAGDIEPREFLDGLYLNLISATVLPIATLILATNALGNEIEDRTMVYLVLKPISRLRIVLEKYVAVAATAMLLLGIGNIVSWLIVMRGDTANNFDLIVAIQISTLFGVLANAAVFLAVSLIVPRALLAGIMYSLLWESTFTRFIPGIRLMSIRHYVQSMYVRIVDDVAITLDEAMQLGPAIIVLVLVIVVSLAVATWRLRTMNLE